MPRRQRPSLLLRGALCTGLLAGTGVLAGPPALDPGPAAPPAAAPVASARPGIIADIQARGAVRCGVGADVRGLASRDTAGHWRGLEIDFCRAVAAAVLGNADKAVPVPLTVEERLRALRDGEVGLLLRNTTWTSSRDITEGVRFAGVLLIDGQGFMVPRSTAILSARQLGGAKLCAVGNYAEMFDRNLGDDAALDSPRGRNAL